MIKQPKPTDPDFHYLKLQTRKDWGKPMFRGQCQQCGHTTGWVSTAGMVHGMAADHQTMHGRVWETYKF